MQVLWALAHGSRNSVYLPYVCLAYQNRVKRLLCGVSLSPTEAQAAAAKGQPGVEGSAPQWQEDRPSNSSALQSSYMLGAQQRQAGAVAPQPRWPQASASRHAHSGAVLANAQSPSHPPLWPRRNSAASPLHAGTGTSTGGVCSQHGGAAEAAELTQAEQQEVSEVWTPSAAADFFRRPENRVAQRPPQAPTLLALARFVQRARESGVSLAQAQAMALDGGDGGGSAAEAESQGGCGAPALFVHAQRAQPMSTRLGSTACWPSWGGGGGDPDRLGAGSRPDKLVGTPEALRGFANHGDWPVEADTAHAAMGAALASHWLLPTIAWALAQLRRQGVYVHRELVSFILGIVQCAP